ncbi:hypothetical protein IJG73_00750, partial [Candidatus Saccharibacteria bacterium]|nr:hypothetical protein [Candidatus Saccharibacteria bacterium]
CWMVQNLDLDLSTSVALTNQNTDLNSKASWTPQNSTQTTTGTVWAEDGGDTARSMDPGNIYLPGGMGSGTADSVGNLQGATSGEPWELIGNYYNWYAATAGSGTSTVIGNDAPDSICPKGWKLPDKSGEKSVQNLFVTAYGIANDATGASKATATPLNLARGGLYWWSNGRIGNQGAVGYWYTATADTRTDAYVFTISSTSVSPYDLAIRGNGRTIRCVAR